jgi:hypothetical protein
MIEGELPYDPNQYYVSLASQAGWTDIGDVRVLNLERYVVVNGVGQWIEAQDQLTLVPEPGTLLLLSIGFALIVFARRSESVARASLA